MATFVLIHGGGGSAWDWHLVARELREDGHDPTAVDLPCEDESAGWWDYADAVVGAIGDRSEVVVIGHSLGGFTAPLVCARIPVDLLVLVAAMIPSPGELFDDWWANSRYQASGYDDVFYHDVHPDLAAEAQRREQDENSSRCANHGRSQRGRARRRDICCAVTTGCFRRRGRAVMHESVWGSSRTRSTAATTSR